MLLVLATLIPILPQQSGQPPADPPIPTRAYEPHLINPGLNGEYNLGFQTGDVTPDGRLLIAFRDENPNGFPYRSILAASIVRPEWMLRLANGHLDRFFKEPPASPEDFTFGSLADQTRIHYGWEVLPCTPGTPGCLPCGLRWNDEYPIGGQFGNAHITLCLRPEPHGNPYRSDDAGEYAADGDHLTYKIWIVRTHMRAWEVDPAKLQCTGLAQGEPLAPTAAALAEVNPGNPIFVCQDLTVVIDEDTGAGDPAIVHTSIGPWTELTGIPVSGSPDAFVHGIEPSISADGRLIVYHGNADQPFVIGHANITYVYNSDPCTAGGWSRPRSITELPDDPDIAPLTLAQFQQRYRLFAQPIRTPKVSAGNLYSEGHTFAPGDTVRGAYPWLSKDGSFFTAMSTTASEAIEYSTVDEVECVPANSNRIRSGMYVCGDITGGYMKHIDDVGANPTRRGGPWSWPADEDIVVFCGEWPNSWRAQTFSTGMKPGTWQPFPGQDVPIPTQVAGSRIPVLPLFSAENDSYGEVRFEEADGNCLLYLGCNESIVPDHTSGAPAGERDFLYDVRSTPDTSGRPVRARNTLNAGAGFPQDFYPQGTHPTRSAALRNAIGNAIGNGGPAHECIGLKGQAIVFNLDGMVESRGASGLGGLQGFTVQAFVKVLVTPPPGSSTVVRILEYGGESGGTYTPAVTLELAQGRFVARAKCNAGGMTVTLEVESRANAIQLGQSMVDPSAGWRHVAVSFDGSGTFARLRLFLNGLLDETAVLSGPATAWTPPGAPYYLVGPGKTASPLPLTNGNKVLAIDEVAVSDVARSAAELRRDAYVEAVDPAFGPWPALPVPQPPAALDPDDAFWPDGVTYSTAVIHAGRLAFASPLLSQADDRACATCHVPTQSFALPGIAIAPAVAGQPPLSFNVPTLLNAAFGLRKLFDGSAASLEDQVLRPLVSGSEMGVQTIEEVVDDINGDPALGAAFQSAFSGPATEARLAKALSMYVRTLNTGGTSFDNQLLFERDGAFDAGLPTPGANEQLGFELFFGKARCFTCHSGPSLSDDDFHNILSVVENPLGSGQPRIRGAFTGRAAEDGKLKTPTLRNVAMTGPWFHDGSKTTLEAVVDHYNDPPFAATDRVGAPDRFLRALDLSPSERTALVAFLNSLTGTVPP